MAAAAVAGAGIATDGRTTDASVTSSFEASTRRTLAPGVDFAAGSMETTSGDQRVRVAIADPGDPSVSVAPVLSNGRVLGREPVSDMAERTSREDRWAVAAVNGDFWIPSGGGAYDAPLGLHVGGGELMVAGRVARPSLGIASDGRMRIGVVKVDVGLVAADGKTTPVARVNQARASDEVVLYTTRFGARTPSSSAGSEIVVRVADLPLRPSGTSVGEVVAIREGATGGTPIPAGHLVISAHGSGAARIATVALGHRLSVTTAITPGWEGTRAVVGGDRFIVQDAAVRVSAPPPPSGLGIYASDPYVHPRTAIGLTEDGRLIVATVDGRDPGSSEGVRVEELGELMVGLGARVAINVDGGGSTTMAIRARDAAGLHVANRPSDGEERAVTNGLVIYSSDPFRPTAGAPRPTLAEGRRIPAAGESVPATVAWTATDPQSGPAGSVLERLRGSSWTPLVLEDPASWQRDVSVPVDRAAVFRVRVSDLAGNRSAWREGPARIATLMEPGETGVTITGGWSAKEDAAALGGSVHRASGPGAGARVTFRGRAVGVVVTVGPGGGTIELVSDGTVTRRIGLAADERTTRLVVATQRWPRSAVRTVEVRVVSAESEVVELDAFVTLD